MLCIVLSQWSAQLDIAFTPPIYSKYAFNNGAKSSLNLNFEKPHNDTVKSGVRDTKFSDNLWFSDYFTKTVFPFTT